MATMMTANNRPRRMWTKEEDDTLRRMADAQAQANNGVVKDWCSISKMLPGRTNKDCRKRFSKVTKSVNKGTWSPAEDQRLLQAIETCGPSWQLVAEKVGTRHAEQCAKRWQHSLDPAIDRSEWTPEEDQTLVHAVTTMGRSWRSIAQTYFPQRSTTDIKNHFEYVSRRMRNSVAPTKSSATSLSPEPMKRTSSSSSDASEDTGSSSIPGSGEQRPEHMFPGSQADMFLNFGHSQSPAARTPMDFRQDDFMLLSQQGGMGTPGSGDVTLFPFDGASTPGHGAGTPGVHPSATHFSHAMAAAQQFSPMPSDYMGSPLDATSSDISPADTASQTSYFSFPPASDGSFMTPNAMAQVQQQLRSGSCSPGSRCRLVLDEVATENVGMILGPLMRSGVNVKMNVYS